jgi:hypothetical protein
MHITAVGQIDGQIRQDVIPLRINLTTGKCDISGNAVTAGTLIDNTGELVPTVAEINAFMDGDRLNPKLTLTGNDPNSLYIKKNKAILSQSKTGITTCATMRTAASSW